MRVRQVQTLVWIGNVLVLAGAGWVGWNFVATKKAQAKTEKAEWPEVAAKPIDSRWPGDVKAFTHIWETPVNGPVPPKPEERKIDEPKPDPEKQFREKLQITGGMLGSSSTTTVNFTFDSKAATLRLGEMLEGLGRSWQFVRFDFERATGTATARFVSRDLDVVVSQQPPSMKPLTREESGKFTAAYGGAVDANLVGREKIDRPAFEHRPGEWTVTYEETLWWDAYGDAEVLSKLSAKSETDPEGNARGVRLIKVPSPPALGEGRGLRQGDLVRSVNGVPTAGLEDVTNYLRGAGRGLPRYVVVIERDGAEKTLVYDVERRSSERSP